MPIFKLPQSSLTGKRRQAGYTLLEVLVSISLFVVVIVMVGTIFNLAQRTYQTAANRNELLQNLRVYFDRVSRELRQASELVTDLTATSTTIMFQDGHNNNYISYIEYILDGNIAHRRHIVYHFDPWPVTDDQYCLFSSVDGAGNPPNEHVLADEVVGEYFNSLGFIEHNGLITLEAELEKNAITLNFDTKAYVRNGN